MLGQGKVDEKSNEISAVPELLRLLEIKGRIVTADAINTQKETASEIREQGTDYVLALKENHPNLYAEIGVICEAVRRADNADRTVSFTESVERNHGRRETRMNENVKVIQ